MRAVGARPHLGLLVRFTLKERAGPAFDQPVAETLEQIRAREPGTLVHASHLVNDEPNSRIFYELYRDRAAFDEHEATNTRRSRTPADSWQSAISTSSAST